MSLIKTVREFGDDSLIELSPISRNAGRFLNIFICDSSLSAGGTVSMFYDDDSEIPFHSEKLWYRNEYDEFLVSISSWELRRRGFEGAFSIRIEIFDADGSAVGRLLLPVKGKRAKRYRGT